MILFKRAIDLRYYLDKHRKEGKKYGFVPTMGALHDGHISLINNSKLVNELTVCSIFINPMQFNDPKDYEKYPVTIEKDILLLEAAGCDILFLPSVIEMYPGGTKTSTYYELGYLEKILEGKYRPGHFQGVCTIVHRLLDMVKPDNLYLGQKDYQQCMVIKKLIELTGMKDLVKLHISPTLRETTGLAMSSRNMRLTENERMGATAIYKELFTIQQQLKKGSVVSLIKQAAANLIKKGFRVDYVEIADAGNLSPVEEWNGEQKLVALAAAHLNDIRLIDNILLN